jgi:hypothetical protein
LENHLHQPLLKPKLELMLKPNAAAACVLPSPKLQPPVLLLLPKIIGLKLLLYLRLLLLP